MSLEGKRGLEEGRSLYTYVADVFYLLYICFGMEEGTFLELLCMYLSVYLRVRTSIYILGICVSFLASYMCTVGQGRAAVPCRAANTRMNKQYCLKAD